jgi:hypothetical protein
MTFRLGTRLAVPDVVRRLVERGLPELIVAGAAGHPDVAHAAAAFGSLQGRRADAGLPADLGAAGPQLMTERAKLGLVFENRYCHETIMPRRAVSQSCLIGAGRACPGAGALTGPFGDLEELGDAGAGEPAD